MATATKKKSGKSGKVKLQPLGERVVVQRDESLDVTAGGIVLPEAAKEKPARGKILAVGDGKLLANGERGTFQVKKGDHVLFSSYAGETLTIDDQEYILMREDDILVVIE